MVSTKHIVISSNIVISNTVKGPFVQCQAGTNWWCIIVNEACLQLWEEQLFSFKVLRLFSKRTWEFPPINLPYKCKVCSQNSKKWIFWVKSCYFCQKIIVISSIYPNLISLYRVKLLSKILVSSRNIDISRIIVISRIVITRIHCILNHLNDFFLKKIIF